VLYTVAWLFPRAHTVRNALGFRHAIGNLRGLSKHCIQHKPIAFAADWFISFA
jgi:hypothetical protein